MKNKIKLMTIIISLFLLIISYYIFIEKSFIKTNNSEDFLNVIDSGTFDQAYDSFEKNFSLIDKKVNELDLEDFYYSGGRDIFLQMAYICRKFNGLNKDNLVVKKIELKMAKPFLILSDPTEGTIYKKEEIIKYNKLIEKFLYTNIGYNDFYEALNKINLDDLILSKNSNIKKLGEAYIKLYSEINNSYNSSENVDCKKFLRENYSLSKLSYD